MLSFAELARGLFHALVLNGAAIGTAVLLGRRFFPRRYLAERFQVAALLWAAVVVYPCLLLGAFGILTRGGLLAVEVGIFIAASIAALGFGPRPVVPAGRPGPFAYGMGFFYGLLALPFAAIALAHPPLAWDTLDYHAPLAVEWMQSGSLDPLYHPASPHHGYFPGTAELFVLWAILPFSNDLCMGLVNLPLLALGGVAVYRIALLCGASPGIARWVPLLYLCTPAVARHAPTAYAEPALNAFLLSAVVHLLEYRRERREDAVTLLGLALGLAVGTKYTALAYAGWLGLLALALLVRRRARAVGPLRLSVAAAFVVGGAFWYFRNLALTGHPLYPAQVSLFGFEIWPAAAWPAWAGQPLEPGYLTLDGIWDAMRAGRLAEALLGSATPGAYELGLGPKVGPLALGILAGSFWVLRRRAWRQHPDLALGLALAIAFGLAFLATPLWRMDWLDSNVRFAAPALSVAASALAAWAEIHRVAEGRFAAAVVVCVLPDLFVLVARAGDAERLIWGLGLLVPAIGLAARWPRRRPGGRLVAAGIGLVTAAVLLAGVAVIHRARETSRHHHYARTWDLHASYAPYYAAGWRWLDAHARGRERVAHAGSEYLYPLYGPRLERRVRYVDVNDADGGAHHAYAPGTHRLGADPAIWLRNLERHAVDWLVVERPWYARAFPAEAVWADSRPDRFRLAFASAHSRIYEVRRP